MARILLRFLLALLGSVVLAGPASADWTAYGERVYASSFAGFIARPDGRGGLLIGVGDIRSTTGFTGTLKFYAQHVDSSGARLVGWPLDGLPIAAPSQDAMPTDIVADEAGGAFGCWMPSSYPSGRKYDVQIQRFDAGGNHAPFWPDSGVVVAAQPQDEIFPILCDDSRGGVFVAWQDLPRERALFDFYPRDIRIKRYTGTGQLAPAWPDSGIALTHAPGDHELVSLLSDGTGGAYLGWNDDRASPGVHQVYVQHVSATGQLVAGWPDGGIKACNDPSYEYLWGQDRHPLICDGKGGLILVWQDNRSGDGCSGDIYAQHLDVDGTRATGWPAEGLAVCVQPGCEGVPEACPDGRGGAYFSWQDERTGGDSPYLQHVLGDGSLAPGWPQDGLALAGTNLFALEPQLAEDGEGGAFVSWYGGPPAYQTRAIHVLADARFAPGWPLGGTLLGAPSDVEHSRGALVPAGRGSAIVVWEELGSPMQGGGIFAQKLVTDGVVAALLALTSSDATSDAVTLTWSGANAAQAALHVERRVAEGAWSNVGTPRATGEDRLVFEDHDVTPGERYAYRLTDVAGREVVRESWVSVPAAARFALQGAHPNPATAGAMSVRFSLAERGAGSLDLLDLAGRRLASRPLGTFAAGEHELRLSESADLAPGVYWLRLQQSGHLATSRIAIIR